MADVWTVRGGSGVIWLVDGEEGSCVGFSAATGWGKIKSSRCGEIV